MNRLKVLTQKYRNSRGVGAMLSNRIYCVELVSKSGNDYTFYYNVVDDYGYCNINDGEINDEEKEQLKSWYKSLKK